MTSIIKIRFIIFFLFSSFSSKVMGQTEIWKKYIPPRIFVENNIIYHFNILNTGSLANGLWYFQRFDTNGNLLSSDTVAESIYLSPRDLVVVDGDYFITAILSEPETFHGFSGTSTLLIKFSGNTMQWICQFPNLLNAKISYSSFNQSFFIAGYVWKEDVNWVGAYSYTKGAVVGRIDNQGNCNWVKNIPSMTNALKICSKNDFITVHTYNDTSLFIQRINDSGNILWTIPSSGINSMVMDNDLNCYITGSEGSGYLYKDINSISKISPTGNLVWKKFANYGGAGYVVEISSDNKIIASGPFGQVNHSEGFGVQKYDTSGNEIWHFQYPDTINSSYGAPYVINVSCSMENIFLSGYSNHMYDGGFLIKLLDSDYNLIKKRNSTHSYTIYPNPTNNILYITTNAFSSINLKIIDISGIVVYRKRFREEDTNNIMIDLNGRSKGIYILEIEDGKNYYKEKIVLN